MENTEEYPEMVRKAIDFATEKHQGQYRKNSKKEDYIVHPLEVMHLLKDYGVSNENIWMAAVLHDTIEDTSATYEEIKECFGKSVADIVLEVSDDKSLPKLTRKKLQVSKISQKSFGARMIKIGDKLSNTAELLIDPPTGWSSIQIIGYISWSEKICENAMSLGDTPRPLIEVVKVHFETLGTSTLPANTLESYYDSMS